MELTLYNIAIHTPTEAEANELTEMLMNKGYRREHVGEWHMFKDKTIFSIERNRMICNCIAFAHNHPQKYTIISLQEFKKLNLV